MQISFIPFIKKHSYLVSCMAGFHSTASDAWLHAKDQCRTSFDFWAAWIGVGTERTSAGGIHASQGTFSISFIYQNKLHVCIIV